MARRPGIFILTILSSVFLSSLPFPSFSQNTETTDTGARSYTIKDAINIAILNNKAIQIQEQEVEFARANILYAKSAFLPQVSAGYSYTYIDAVLYESPMPGYKKDTRIFTGYKNDNALNFTLNESVYNGGADIATLAEARLGLKYQEQTLRARKLDVEFEAKRLFYGILLAYETRRIARDLVDQAQAHYEETAKMYKHGTASKFDVLQSKVNVSVVYPQLVNAENAIELIMAEFKKLLSLDMMRPIEIDGKLAYKLIEINTEEFLSEAYRRNPQMILKLLGIDINKWAIEYAKAGWYPDISANAAYAFNSNTMSSMLGSRHSNWSVGVKASIAIFDGFATKAKVDEAKARYNQSRLQKEDLAEQLAVDVVSACLDLEKAKAIIDAESDSISEAKESLRLANIRFENGVGINLDIIDAQVALAQVQQSLAQAIYDYIMAKAQLDRTMGHEFYKEEHYYANP